MMSRMGDPVLVDSWMPVTNSRDVTADVPLGVDPARHSDRALAQPRRHRSTPPATSAPIVAPRCRWARCATTRSCAGYHGWVYDSGGRCVRQPASPGLTPPPKARLEMFGVCERYGVVFVALGHAAGGATRLLPRVGRARCPPLPRRAGRRARVRAAHRRELPRHGPLPVRARRRARRRVAHRGAGLHGDRQRRRHRGHRLLVLATGGDAGFDGRRRRRVPLPGAPPLRGDAVQAPARRRRRLLADDHGLTPRRGALPDLDDRRLHRPRRSTATTSSTSTTASSSRTCPILESQRPRQLPLDPTAELAQKADRASTPTAAGSPTSACGTARSRRGRTA